MEYNNSNRIHATHSVGARDIRTAGGPGLSGRGAGGRAPFAYLTRLPPGKAVLWCYLIWYLSTVAHHFDPSPKLWLNALGISGVIGIALMLSVAGTTRPDRWQTARLFMMPFGVSSFSALIKGQGFVLIFPPTWAECAVSAGACALFLAVVAAAKALVRQPGTTPQ